MTIRRSRKQRLREDWNLVNPLPKDFNLLSNEQKRLLLDNRNFEFQESIRDIDKEFSDTMKFIFNEAKKNKSLRNSGIYEMSPIRKGRAEGQYRGFDDRGNNEF